MSVPRSHASLLFSTVAAGLVAFAALHTAAAARYSDRVDGLCKAGTYLGFDTPDAIPDGPKGDLIRDVSNAADTRCNTSFLSFITRAKFG